MAVTAEGNPASYGAFTLAQRGQHIPLVEPVGLEPAGGVGGADEPVAAVAVELEPAAWSQPGLIDHASVDGRIVDAAVSRWGGGEGGGGRGTGTTAAERQLNGMDSID